MPGYDPNVKADCLNELEVKLKHDDDHEDAVAFDQMNDYIHRAEQLCDSMHLEENHKREIKKSLGSINAQLYQIQKHGSSQRSIPRNRREKSSMFIDLDKNALLSKKYVPTKKMNARYATSDKYLVQRSMY